MATAKTSKKKIQQPTTLRVLNNTYRDYTVHIFEVKGGGFEFKIPITFLHPIFSRVQGFFYRPTFRPDIKITTTNEDYVFFWDVSKVKFQLYNEEIWDFINETFKDTKYETLVGITLFLNNVPTTPQLIGVKNGKSEYLEYFLYIEEQEFVDCLKNNTTSLSVELDELSLFEYNYVQSISNNKTILIKFVDEITSDKTFPLGNQSIDRIQDVLQEFINKYCGSNLKGYTYFDKIIIYTGITNIGEKEYDVYKTDSKNLGLKKFKFSLPIEDYFNVWTEINAIVKNNVPSSTLDVVGDDFVIELELTERIARQKLLDLSHEISTACNAIEYEDIGKITYKNQDFDVMSVIDKRTNRIISYFFLFDYNSSINDCVGITLPSLTHYLESTIPFYINSLTRKLESGSWGGRILFHFVTSPSTKINRQTFAIISKYLTEFIDNNCSNAQTTNQPQSNVSKPDMKISIDTGTNNVGVKEYDVLKKNSTISGIYIYEFKLPIEDYFNIWVEINQIVLDESKFSDLNVEGDEFLIQVKAKEEDAIQDLENISSRISAAFQNVEYLDLYEITYENKNFDLIGIVDKKTQKVKNYFFIFDYNSSINNCFGNNIDTGYISIFLEQKLSFDYNGLLTVKLKSGRLAGKILVLFSTNVIFNQNRADEISFYLTELIDTNCINAQTTNQPKSNVTTTSIPSNMETITNTEVQSLKYEINDLVFIKQTIPNFDIEKLMVVGQKINGKQKQLNDLIVKMTDERMRNNSIFDNLFEQSFLPLKSTYQVYIENETENDTFFTPSGDKSYLKNRLSEIIRSDSFKSWFGNWEAAYQYRDIPNNGIDCSKIVRENGEPLVVWHGTGSPFSYFKFNNFPAAYFARNEAYSRWFAELHGENGGYTIPFFLNLKNPLDLTKFKTDEVYSKDFFDYIFVKTGLTAQNLEVNPAFLDPNLPPLQTWMYMRNNPRMLLKLSESNVFDGIEFYETNPGVPESESAHSTRAYIIFKPESAKIADPDRGDLIFGAMKSFLLAKGGKI